MFPLVVTVLIVIVIFDRLPSDQECCHWIVLVRIHVRITKFDVNDGVDLTISQTSDHHISPCFIFLVTTLAYLLLGSGMALMYYGFGAYRC